MKTIRVLSLLLAISMIGLISCSQKSSSPGDTVKKMVEKMEAGDMSVKDLMAKDLAALFDDEKMATAVEDESAKIAEKGGITSVVIDEETIEEDTAHVKYTITYGNEETEAEEADLIKEDGDWKVTASK